MGVVVGAVNLPFAQQVILVMVSAVMSGVFALLVAYLQIRANRDTHARLEALEERQKDVAGAVGVRKRRTDHEVPEEA